MPPDKPDIKNVEPRDFDYTPLKNYWDHYDFYGTPDGEECLPKTFYYTKYCGVAGLIVSAYEVALYSRQTTYIGALTRFARFTGPFAGMGFVFGSALCAIAQYRKKDDVLNHILAGAAAGSVWGFKYNSYTVGQTWAFFGAFFMGYYKYFKVHNIPIYGKEPKSYLFQHPYADFSVKLYDDPGRPPRP